MEFTGFEPDIKITEVVKAGDFTISAEVIPPRNGTPQAAVMAQIGELVGSGAQFLSVTKGAGGSLRGGSLPIAQVIKERLNVPCIAHFTCRDLTPEEVENQLMDHHYFGVRNILALRGDPPQGKTEWVARDGAYNYAYQLMEQIRNLNNGIYLERKGFRVEDRHPTDFCIGAAVYPDHPHAGERIEFFRRKIEAGAEYGITQMVFDERSFGEFLNRCAKERIHVPVLAGTRILRSRQQGQRMAQRFGVPLPKAYLNELPDADDAVPTLDHLLQPFFRFVERLKDAGAHGLHLFVLSDTESASVALRQLAQTRMSKHEDTRHGWSRVHR